MFSAFTLRIGLQQKQMLKKITHRLVQDPAEMSTRTPSRRQRYALHEHLVSKRKERTNGEVGEVALSDDGAVGRHEEVERPAGRGDGRSATHTATVVSKPSC